MNSFDNTELTEIENLPSNSPVVEAEIDDDFENEELGERQPEACSIDGDCLSCQ